MYPTEARSQWPVQQPIFYANSNNTLNASKGQSQQSVFNGIFQIIAGVSCVILNSVSLGIYVGWSVVAYGFWGGVFYIITGIFGILAGKMMTKCTMITFMVLCIISASLVFPAHFILAVFGAVLEIDNGLEYSNSDASETLGILNIVLSILAGIEFIFAVWGSAIWCRTVGCCRPRPVTSDQVITMSNGQPFVQVPGPVGQYAPYNAQYQHYPNYPAPYAPGYSQQVNYR